jgi:hypothetical protein
MILLKRGHIFAQKIRPFMKKHTKILLAFVLVLFVFGLCFRLFCGIFVIQPMEGLTNGVTIVYWRSGMTVPFISSADCILEKSGSRVSEPRRVNLLNDLIPKISKRAILRAGYSDRLYLYSTGGKKYTP